MNCSAAALVALDRADEAAKSIAKLGVVVDDRYGTPKSNPAVDIELRNRALVARIFGQLGIKSQAEERWNPTRAKARHAPRTQGGITDGRAAPTPTGQPRTRRVHGLGIVTGTTTPDVALPTCPPSRRHRNTWQG